MFEYSRIPFNHLQSTGGCPFARRGEFEKERYTTVTGDLFSKRTWNRHGLWPFFGLAGGGSKDGFSIGCDMGWYGRGFHVEFGMYMCTYYIWLFIHIKQNILCIYYIYIHLCIHIIYINIIIHIKHTDTVNNMHVHEIYLVCLCRYYLSLIWNGTVTLLSWLTFTQVGGAKWAGRADRSASPSFFSMERWGKDHVFNGDFIVI